jgi:hypothetical protein
VLIANHLEQDAPPETVGRRRVQVNGFYFSWLLRPALQRASALTMSEYSDT